MGWGGVSGWVWWMVVVVVVVAFAVVVVVAVAVAVAADSEAEAEAVAVVMAVAVAVVMAAVVAAAAAAVVAAVVAAVEAVAQAPEVLGNWCSFHRRSPRDCSIWAVVAPAPIQPQEAQVHQEAHRRPTQQSQCCARPCPLPRYPNRLIPPPTFPTCSGAPPSSGVFPSPSPPPPASSCGALPSSAPSSAELPLVSLGSSSSGAPIAGPLHRSDAGHRSSPVPCPDPKRPGAGRRRRQRRGGSRAGASPESRPWLRAFFPPVRFCLGSLSSQGRSRWNAPPLCWTWRQEQDATPGTESRNPRGADE